MSKQKRHSEKLGVEVIVYSYEKSKKKKFTQIHKNKDGTITKWGVTKRGYKFTSKFYPNISTKTKLEKIFKDAQNKSNLKKNNVTMKTFNYKGKLDKTLNHVTGIKQNTQYYKVTKNKSRKPGKIYTYKVDIILDEIESFREQYLIKELSE